MVAILSAELGRLSSRTHSFVSLCGKLRLFLAMKKPAFTALKACVRVFVEDEQAYIDKEDRSLVVS